MAVRLRRDLLRRLQSDALRRGRAGVARGAALLDDRLRLRRRRPAGPVVEPPASGGLIQTAIAASAAAAVTGIHQTVRPAWRRLKKWRIQAPTSIRQTSTSQPSACPYANGEVVAEHGQEHGQRQVVVVHRPLLRADRRRRVRLPSRLLRPHEIPVGRDDDEEDVRDHDRPQHRPELEPDRAVGVEEAQAVGAGRRRARRAPPPARARCGARGRGRRTRPTPRRAAPAS